MSKRRLSDSVCDVGYMEQGILRFPEIPNVPASDVIVKLECSEREDCFAFIASPSGAPSSTYAVFSKSNDAHKLVDDGLDTVRIDFNKKSESRMTSIAIFSVDFGHAALVAIGDNSGCLHVYTLDAFLVAKTSNSIGIEVSSIVALQFMDYNGVLFLFAITKGGLLTGFDVTMLIDSAADSTNRMKTEISPLVDSSTSRIGKVHELAQHHQLFLDLEATPTGHFVISTDGEHHLVIAVEKSVLEIFLFVGEKKSYRYQPITKVRLSQAIRALAFSKEYRESNVCILAAGLEDGDVAIIDAAKPMDVSPTFVPYFYFPCSPSRYKIPVNSLSFYRAHFGTSNLMVVSSGNHVRVVDFTTYSVIYDYDFDYPISRVMFITEGKNNVPCYVACSGNGGASLMYIRDWGKIGEGICTHKKKVVEMGFSSSSQVFVTVGGQSISIFDATSMLISKNAIPTSNFALPPSSAISYSSTTGTVAMASKDVQLFNVKKTKFVAIHVSTELRGNVNALSFSPDGSMLLIAGRDDKVLIANTSSRKVVSRISVQDGVKISAWSAHGIIALANIDASKIYLFDINDHKMLPDIDLKGNSASCLQFNGDGTLLAIGCANRIFVAELRKSRGKIIQEIYTFDTIISLRFSPDANTNFLASVSNEGSCQIYSGRSFAHVQDLLSSTSKYNNLAFDSTGTILALGNYDGSIDVFFVGEVFNVDWFPVYLIDQNGKMKFGPKDICSNLHLMTEDERAQFVYYSKGDADADDSDIFPLENAIENHIAWQQKKFGKMRASEKRIKFSSIVGLNSYLREILINFPKAVFASPGEDDMFKTLLKKGESNILNAVYKAALKDCVSYPEVMMNDCFRSGELTKNLIETSDIFPEVAVNALEEMVFWPLPTTTADVRSMTQKPVFQVARSPTQKGMFKNLIGKGGGLARLMMYPLPGLASLQSLYAFTSENSYEAFKNNEMHYVVDELWNNEIKYTYLGDFFTFLIFYSVFSRYVIEMNYNEEVGIKTIPWVKWITIFFLNSYYLWLEITQLSFGFGLKEIKDANKKNQRHLAVEDFQNGSRGLQRSRLGRNKLKKPRNTIITSTIRAGWKILDWAFETYLKDVWNIFDLLAIIVVYVTLFITVYRTSVTLEFQVISTLFQTVKLLGYLRGFETSGWLLIVLVKNFEDSAGFLMVIPCCLAGFAIMYRVLIGGDENFDSFGTMLYKMFDYGVLGGFDPSLYEDSDDVFLGFLLFLMLLIIINLLAMNAYIALLTDSYQRVKDHETATKYLQKASLLVEYYKTMNLSKRKHIETERRYFFALVPIENEEAELAKQSVLNRKEFLYHRTLRKEKNVS